MISACNIIWITESNEEAIQFPPRWLPGNPTLENYVFAWTDMKFGCYFFSTVYVSGMTVILSLVLGALAGYGFARFRRIAIGDH